MAISRADLLQELLPALNELFGDAYSGWAVHTDYSFEHNEWRIAKVEAWMPFKHEGASHIIHVKDAPDEMGAYAEVMRRWKEQDKCK